MLIMQAAELRKRLTLRDVINLSTPFLQVY